MINAIYTPHTTYSHFYIKEDSGKMVATSWDRLRQFVEDGSTVMVSMATTRDEEILIGQGK